METLSQDVSIYEDRGTGQWVVRVLIHSPNVYERWWREIGRFPTRAAAIKRASHINK